MRSSLKYRKRSGPTYHTVSGIKYRQQTGLKYRTVRELSGEIHGEIATLLRAATASGDTTFDGFKWEAETVILDLVMAVLARHDQEILINDPDMPVEPLPRTKTPQYAKLRKRIEGEHLFAGAIGEIVKIYTFPNIFIDVAFYDQAGNLIAQKHLLQEEVEWLKYAKLLKSFPIENLRAGMVGLIVKIHTFPTLSYDVEFSQQGNLIARKNLLPTEVEIED